MSTVTAAQRTLLHGVLQRQGDAYILQATDPPARAVVLDPRGLAHPGRRLSVPAEELVGQKVTVAGLLLDDGHMDAQKIISKDAIRIWAGALAVGRHGGSPEEHWLEAEEELLDRSVLLSGTARGGAGNLVLLGGTVSGRLALVVPHESLDHFSVAPGEEISVIGEFFEHRFVVGPKPKILEQILSCPESQEETIARSARLLFHSEKPDVQRMIPMFEARGVATRREIAAKADSYTDGSPLDHWLRAERELLKF
jgi:hypothetical protein